MGSSIRDRIQAAKTKVPQKLKPKVTAWMLANQNHEFSDEAIEVAIETLKRARRTPQYMRNSPSGGHQDFCDRRAVIAFNGYSSDPVDDIVTLNKFADGNYGHLMWQLRLFDMGFMKAEHVEMFVSVPHWGVAGTCDGVMSVPMVGWDPRMSREETRQLVDDLAQNEPESVWWSTLEVKRMASYRFRNCVVNASTESKILWQGTDYWMGARAKLGIDIVDVCYWHEHKDTNEFIEFDVVPSDKLIEQMHEFYTNVLQTAGRKELPSRVFETGSRECNSCFFESHCDRFEKKGRTTLGPAKGKRYDGSFPEPK